ncbi:MAG: nucleotidyltransferase domain-containing protein [Nitrososphaerota archaeon]|nr:nucleotidyltransferase domain-containing protein [Nitrososphaerota archaeon]MDG7026764.1 nucleotidyltransferase domain-containing protein [Nitrososphaerota archaeon]
MAETKVYIPDSLDAQLREAAMKRFGYGRGSISKAVETAVAQWLKTEAAIRGAIDAVVSRAKDDRNAVAVILFGSYARKEPAFGDVDVALVLKDPRGSDLLAYGSAIEGRGAFSPVKLDVVAFNSLPLDLKRSVLNEGVVLYAADERELRAVAAEVAEEWSDFAPTLEYLSS